MPPPTPLAIATSSLHRLLKEEASYHAELAMQQKSIQRLEQQQQQQGDAEAEDDEEEDGSSRGNREFLLRQEKKALEETRAVFPTLTKRIQEAVGNLEGLLASAEEGDAEAVRAREVVGEARKATG